jgi:hypothetical protein
VNKKILEIPHSICRYTCTVNGIRDIYQYKTHQYIPGEFITLLTGFADFVYLKNKKAKPRFMVFWAKSLKEHYKAIEYLFGFKIQIKQGRSFPFALGLVKKEINGGNPVIIGPLDMFHLEYRQDLFHKVHTTAHFVLAVGFDDNNEKLYVHDCDLYGLQALGYENLRLAWQKDEPGYIRKNAVITVSLPKNIPMFNKGLVKKALSFKAKQMLNPGMRNFGIPGMRKLAKEFSSWRSCLGKKDYKTALGLMAMFANTPPTLAEGIDNFTGKRKELADLLDELAKLTNEESFREISYSFKLSGELIRGIAHIILNYLKGEKDERKAIPGLLETIADIEEKAYVKIQKAIDFL